MSVTAQAGTVGFAPQTGKGALCPNTDPDYGTCYWQRHRAVMVDLDAVDDVREGPPEVGGVAVPTFPYKSGPVVAGGMSIQPRLIDSLGWLLYGLLGSVDSDNDYGNVYQHVFKFATGDNNYVPWMSFRKHIPRKDNGVDTDLGIIFKDCKIVGATLALPNDAPVGMRLDVIGREFFLDSDPTTWNWNANFESWESIPVACQTDGFIEIDGSELPIVQAQIGFQNVPLDLRQERIFGDPYLEDVTIVQRRLTFDIMVKWNNPQLYRKVLTGAASGVDAWSGTPYTASLHMKTVSSHDMLTAGKYSLEVEAPECMMTQVGGIALAGSQAVMLRFAGVALENDPYCSITLRNEVHSYAWPT
jgi:hypothetical protein